MGANRSQLTKFNADGSIAIASVPSTGNPSLDSVAVDGGGNAWVTNNSEYLMNGALLAKALGDGFPHLGISYRTVDASGSVWSVGYVYHRALYTRLVGVAVPTGASLSEALAAETLGARP